MLELLAIAREDGFAFVRDGGSVRFLRPPYEQEEVFAEVSEATVARAITDHGFSPVDATFDGWPEIVAHLRRELSAAAREHGLKAPKEGLRAAMLREAMPEMLEAMLEEIEVELLPNGEHDAAEKLLAAMLRESATMREDVTLHDRAVLLVSNICEARDKAEEARQRLRQLVEPRSFPVLRKTHPGLQKARSLGNRFNRRRPMVRTG